MLKKTEQKVIGLLGVLSSLPALAGTLASVPLYLSTSAPSNVLFDISVEYPTGNTAAYQGYDDYNATATYLGYFDANKCYSYSTTDLYFSPVSVPGADRNCGGQWSGNFLNWATMTGLDEFRYAMTGGNRFIDTEDLTILERAYVSNQGSGKTSTYTGTGFSPYAKLDIYNSGAGSTISTSDGTNWMQFYVRVKVCDANAPGGVESNCKQYPNGKYKPVGEVQNNGEKMFFGVFSYYTAPDVQNAVMRSKLKTVAPVTASGITNPNREWDPETGVFVGNPDPTEATNSYGGGVNNSGVINYINKFGYGTQGYKQYDDVGRLYYESLRYLAGLQPTQEFYTRSSPSNNDGFPVITNWNDPIKNSCQKNYIITMGDSHTWCDKRLPGGMFTDPINSPCNGQGVEANDIGGLDANGIGVDVGSWTHKLGLLEGISNLENWNSDLGGSWYISGMAYWAAKNGFRTKDGTVLKAKSYIIDVQENKDEGVGSQYWYAAKYGGVDSFDSSGNPQNWVEPGKFSTTAGNGLPVGSAWPKNLLAAGNPAAMIAAVRSALASIAQQDDVNTGLDVSLPDLRAGNGTNVYSSTFSPAKWSGDLTAYYLGNDLGISYVWKASDKLNPSALNSTAGTPAWKTRRVITFNDGLKVDGNDSTQDNGRQGVEFYGTDATGTDRFAANLSPRQQAFLNSDPATSVADTYGSARVDYLRGDNSNEGIAGHQWRARTTAIGDFVNSTPLYVRFPNMDYLTTGDLASFKVYANAVKGRTPVVYLGSNDGMLHVFNASDTSDTGSSHGATANSGKEMLAYVPSTVYSKLNLLTWKDYTHQYYVDGKPIAGDVQLSASVCNPNTDTTKCWRTLITGGLNAGGQGIYALNGTDPSIFSTESAKNLILWEFTDHDDADLGYTFALPIIRKMNNGKWAVIFGNGYNNREADGKPSSTGYAYLYIVFVDGPSLAPGSGSNRGNKWNEGTDYIKIKLDTHKGTQTASPANGLSAVYALDKNYDGTADYLYAGDRYGNMWKIDVSNTNSDHWGSAFGTASDPEPLFTAMSPDAAPVRQQITTSPLVWRHPYGGYMVLFGTGSFVDTSDQTDHSVNSFYGIWDKDDGTSVSGRSELQHQATLALTTSGSAIQSNCQPQYQATPSTSPSSTLCPANLAATANTDGTVDQQKGWVIDLKYDPNTAATGERYISTVLPEVDSGVLLFTTLTMAGDACNGASKDFSYALDFLTGGAPGVPTFYDDSGVAISETITLPGSSVPVTVYASGHSRSGSGTGQNIRGISYPGNSDGTPIGDIGGDGGGGGGGDGGGGGGGGGGGADVTHGTRKTDWPKGFYYPTTPLKCGVRTPENGCTRQFGGVPVGRMSWRKLINQ